MLDNDKSWLTTSEAAKISGYSTAHIIRWAQKGKLLARKDGRIWYIEYISLKNFMTEVENNARLRRTSLKLKRLQELGQTHKPPSPKILNVGAFLATMALFMLGALGGLLSQEVLKVKPRTEDFVAGVGFIMDELNQAIPILGQTAEMPLLHDE